jgi:2,4-dichlorophenol 6-monooxygenase
MADFNTDVMIVGAGPAGLTCAALLATSGIDSIFITNHSWLANSPRAHLTNQRAMEVIRDLDTDLEREVYQISTPQALLGDMSICTSLSGEQIARIWAFGTSPQSIAEHKLASPTSFCDLPQTLLEPLLFKTACARGSHAKLSALYVSHRQDSDGVTTICRDRLSDREFTVRSKYLVGADGAKSTVAEHAALPIEGNMGEAGSYNIWFKADLTKYVADRPAWGHMIVQPGASIGGVGLTVLRMVYPWTEWLAVMGYNIQKAPPEVGPDQAIGLIRKLVGDPSLDVELLDVNFWTVNNAYATRLQNGRVFCVGDSVHRHPPNNGLGSNMAIQDAHNLAWKLAHVIKGWATPKLLESYSLERVPVAKQVVQRANDSIGTVHELVGAFTMGEELTQEFLEIGLARMAGGSTAGVELRSKFVQALDSQRYHIDSHGVEMNQRYHSYAIVTDGQEEPAYERDPELYYQPTTWPGARVPHAWLFTATDKQVSTLDLCGKGRFSLLTSLTGEAWIEAVEAINKEMGIDIVAHVIAPRHQYRDLRVEWARIREVEESGAILVRPDFIVCWRAHQLPEDPEGELRRVLRSVLGIED